MSQNSIVDSCGPIPGLGTNVGTDVIGSDVGSLTGCVTDWSADYDSTEIPTTWGIKLVIAGAQVSYSN